MAKRPGPRRRYEDDFMLAVVAEASAPETSVAEMVRQHRLNANLVFNWRKKFGEGDTPAPAAPASSRQSAPDCQLVPVDVRPDDAARTPDPAIPALGIPTPNHDTPHMWRLPTKP